MGANGDLLTLAGGILAQYVIVFVVVPLLSAFFIHRGFEKFKVLDVPFARCVQACFFTSSANIVGVFLVNLSYYARRAQERSLWPLLLVYIGVQLVFVPLLIRKRTGKAVLIEYAGLALANVLGYGIFTWLFPVTAHS